MNLQIQPGATARVGVGIVVADEILARRLRGTLARGGHAVVALERSPTALVVAGGKGAVEAVRRAFPGGAVVAIAGAPEARSIRSLVAAGADAVLLEGDLERALEPAIAGALAGQIVLPAAMRAALGTPVLSARERQVAGMVVLGFANAEIAAKLHIAETTVKSHLTTIFRKLGVRSRSEASARILELSEGTGSGFLAISERDPALDVFGDL